MKLLAALVKVFKRPGQELMDFNQEIKKLTDNDKDTYVKWFNETDPAWLAQHGVTLPIER